MRVEQVELSVSMRSEVGKTAARRLRAAGKIPGVIYGRGEESVPIAVDGALFSTSLPASGWRSTVIQLRIEGAGEQDSLSTVMIKEVQRDLVERRVLNVDFHRISLREAVRAQIPVIAVGESPGVKIGGILEHITHEVPVECMPADMPDRIEADISGTNIGSTVRVRDLTPPDGVRVIASEDDVLLVVAPPVRVEELEPVVEVEEGAVVEEALEPEVVGEDETEEGTS